MAQTRVTTWRVASGSALGVPPSASLSRAPLGSRHVTVSRAPMLPSVVITARSAGYWGRVTRSGGPYAPAADGGDSPTRRRRVGSRSGRTCPLKGSSWLDTAIFLYPTPSAPASAAGATRSARIDPPPPLACHRSPTGAAAAHPNPRARRTSGVQDPWRTRPGACGDRRPR